MEEPRRRYGAMMSGLDLRYDLGEGHPLLGRRMPDLDLAIDDESRRAFTLLHDAAARASVGNEPSWIVTLPEPAGFVGAGVSSIAV